MAGLFLVNVLDVGRFLGPEPSKIDVQDVFERIEELYLRPRGGGFNHDPSIRAAYDIFRGASSLQEAVCFCEGTGNPKGRIQNSAIIKAVGPHAVANKSVCHRVGYVAVRIARYRGSNIHIGIKAPFVRVQNRQSAYLVIPGFRKDTRPLGWQLDFVCSVAANQLARDDFEGADVEYLYAGPGDNATQREFCAYYGRDLSLFDADQIDEYLQVYVEAVVRHLERGEGVSPAKYSGYRIVDRAQGTLF
ncbi:hypothetical protein SR870_05770 [Rhodopseudomonas palustris]|uniref:hypothetical protein n=1 Tax=Rhodopseudomonas palustris TaxID=1076 RepID=UPI002ACE5012|nr:hypothetical protein [Rhodopseudomonas palustris]WQH00787.1 hypothetical protein SR870_05770 [Rhodopseudomonas palustris]